MEDLFDLLYKTNIFNGIKSGELEELLKDKPYRLKEYARDEFVAQSGDLCSHLLIVVMGSVRGEMTEFSGRKLKIEDIAAPWPLASAFLFGSENRFPVDIIANSPVTVMIIPRDVIVFLMQNNQVILYNFLNAISNRTQFLSRKIRFLSFKTIKGKMANFLIGHLAKDQSTLVLKQSQTDLADFFGVARPSLARALAEMQEAGILRVERKEITILNREKLNKLLQN